MTVRVRGRPRLGNPDAPSKRAWQPKKWRAEYEQIVALSMQGVSNVALAQKFNFTPVHICNILNTEQAKAIIKATIDHIRGQTVEDSATMMQQISDMTIKRVHKLMTDDRLFSEKPIAAIDRGFRVMEHLGTLKTKVEVQNQTNIGKVVVLPSEAADALLNALDESQEVRKLYPGDDGVRIR